MHDALTITTETHTMTKRATKTQATAPVTQMDTILEVAPPAHAVEEHHAADTTAKRKNLQPLDKADDKKYTMYFNAIPKPVRERIDTDSLDPRRLYNEYRKVGKDALIAKYVPAQVAA